MVSLNPVYTAGVDIAKATVFIPYNLAGLKNITEAVRHYRSGKYKEAKQSGFNGAMRLIGVAVLIGGLYYGAQFRKERLLEEKRIINANQRENANYIKECFKKLGLNDFDHYDEKGVLDYAAINLARNESTDTDVVLETANFYCQTLSGACNSLFFRVDLLQTIQNCRPLINYLIEEGPVTRVGP